MLDYMPIPPGYLCVGPTSWGVGETAAAARSNARRYHVPGGPRARRTWLVYEIFAETKWFNSLGGFAFTWPQHTGTAPRLVEARDGRGKLLPLSSIPPLQAC